MLRINLAPEPAHFDERVRQKGLRWLKDKGISLNSPCPKGTKLPDYWRGSLRDLYDAYEGHCSYSGLRFELAPGGITVDHYVPKSKLVGRAYDWDNYRLACSRLNAKKGVHADVLDPFEIENGWFQLNLFSGRISANRDLDSESFSNVEHTIDRLDLNMPYFCELRKDIIAEYGVYKVRNILRRRSLYIDYEMERQGAYR